MWMIYHRDCYLYDILNDITRIPPNLLSFSPFSLY